MNNNHIASNKKKMALAVSVLILASLACGFDFGSSSTQADPTSLPEIASPTPIFGGSSSLPAAATATAETFPTATSEILPFASTDVTATPPEVSGAACLPGRWSIDLESVSSYMNLTMLGGEFLDFTPTNTGGLIILNISTTQINLVAQDFAVTMTVSVGDVQNSSDFSIVLQSNGTANYEADNNFLNLTSIGYDANGVMTTSTSTFSQSLTDLHNLSKSLGFASAIPTINSSRNLAYSCAGNVLNIVVNQFAAVIFDRVQ